MDRKDRRQLANDREISRIDISLGKVAKGEIVKKFVESTKEVAIDFN